MAGLIREKSGKRANKCPSSSSGTEGDQGGAGPRDCVAEPI